LFARIWEYASTVIGYWQFWVAVAFMIERSVERYFPSFWKWSERYLTIEHRRHVFIAIPIVAFVYANFRAFDAEREAKERALADAKKTPLDPVVLYQDGFPVASVAQLQMNATNNLITFAAVTASRPLDMTKEFEFRDWKLLCSGQEDGSMSFGAMRQINYLNVVCSVQAHR
jgi:hypothetical protein